MTKNNELDVQLKESESVNKTKGNIIKCAWELFYEKGYNETTVNDIIQAANTSKGGFYHYFKAKEDLLDSLVKIFDDKYKEFADNMCASTNSFEKLLMLHSYSFYFMEQNVSIDFFRALYTIPLKGQKNSMFWSKDRFYRKLILEYVVEGQERGEIVNDVSAEYIVHNYLMLERGLCYSWCISDEKYSLAYQGVDIFSRFFACFKKNN